MKVRFSILVISAIVGVLSGCRLDTAAPPSDRKSAVGSDIVINEFYTISPEKHYSYAWIELYNPTDHDVKLVSRRGLEGSGTYRSDSGGLWEHADTGLSEAAITALTMTPSGKLLAGTWGSGVFESADNGDHWVSNSSGLDIPGYVRSLVANDSGVVFAATSSGVFRLDRDSSTWQKRSEGLPQPQSKTFSIAKSSTGTIYVGTGVNGVYKTVDDGETWSAVNNGLPAKLMYALAVNSTGHVFVATTSGVYKSMDDGASWTKVVSGLSNINVYALSVNSNGTIFAGTGGGVFKSDDGGLNWTSANNGLRNRSVRSITIAPNGDLFVGTGEGVFKSANSGSSWAEVGGGLPDNYVISVAVTPTGRVVAGVATGAMEVSYLSLRMKMERRFVAGGGVIDYIIRTDVAEDRVTPLGNNPNLSGTVSPPVEFDGQVLIGRSSLGNDSVAFPATFTVLTNNFEFFDAHFKSPPFDPKVLDVNQIASSDVTLPSQFLFTPMLWYPLPQNDIVLERTTLVAIPLGGPEGAFGVADLLSGQVEVVDAVRFGGYTPSPDPRPWDVSLGVVEEGNSVSRYANYFKTGNSLDEFYITSTPIPGWYSQRFHP